ncbi:MAG: T9SS type A sorting domain-containing protein [Bacteroidetes bacterium]|nr:T9SS type A sorting domain-containing protein [Bacteroidota bacterium]
MKFFIFPLWISSLLFFTTGLTAQTVYTDPELPTADEPVTLYFNATGTPLEGYNGDLYTHTGITVNGSQWQYVIGEWGINNTQPQLTKISTNLYELVMSSGIRDFYNAPSSAEISELCMVFRSEDANTQSADLFLPVFDNELSIFVESPASDAFVVLDGDEIEVSIVSPLADSIYLYLNDVEIAAVADIYLTHTIIAENPTTYEDYQWVTIKAVNETAMVVDSFSFVVIPLPPEADLPAGIKDGINYLSATSVILSLYAPGKDFVFLIGEFNNWELSEASYMNRTPDGNRFWLQIDDLVPGQEYAYQYYVEVVTRVGDPYCEKVLDPWNDQYINNATYPNLKPYPLSTNYGIVSVLQTNQNEYVWQNTNFTPPAVTDLVVYELLVRDFIPQHTFLSLIDTLDYLKRLGVNAIELMPVNEFEGNLSWGYNPNYYFAVDKYYGPKNTLKQFVDACHDEGIAVILDVVYNHSFGTSPYVRIYWDETINAPAENNPFYNTVAKHDFNVGYDMNHESPATKQYISRALKFWLTEYNVDGFRFDLSKGFTQKNTLGNVGAWGQYDQSRIDILNQYADSIFSVNEDAYVILEHFADNSEEKVLSADGMMLWGNMNYNYTEASMGWTSTSDLSWASYQERGWNDPHLVSYMESHDEERMMFKNLEYGNSGNAFHDVKDTAIALKRVPLAAAFFFTIPGPKMIWQFGELGYDYSIEFNGRTGEKPIRWDYYNDYRRKLVYNLFSSMIHLKSEYPVFRTTDYELNVGGAQKQIHLNHTDMNVTVVGNFSVDESAMTVNFQHAGMWFDYFAGDSLNAVSSNHSINLGPGEYRIYTDVKLDRPEIGLSINENPENQNGFDLVYPNPSRADFNMVFKLMDKSKVEINIFNTNGQKIKTILSENLNRGEYTIKWNGTNDQGQKVNKSLYFAELKVDGKRFVSKLSLY